MEAPFSLVGQFLGVLALNQTLVWVYDFFLFLSSCGLF